MIILIRHAQSEGNSELPFSMTSPVHDLGLTMLVSCNVENRAIHQTVPDHRVKLTPQGWKEVLFTSQRNSKGEENNLI